MRFFRSGPAFPFESTLKGRADPDAPFSSLGMLPFSGSNIADVVTDCRGSRFRNRAPRAQRKTRVRPHAPDRRLSRRKGSPHRLAPRSVRSGGHAFRAFHRPTARLVFAPFSVGRVIPRKTDRRRASRPRHRRARGFSDRRAHLASRARGSWKCEETDPRDRRRRDVSRRRRGRRVPGPRHRARACRKTRPRDPARDRRGALRLEGVRGRAAGEAGFRRA